MAPTYMCVNTYMCVCVGSQTRDYRQRFEAEITEHAKDVKALQVCVCLNKQFCVRVCVCVCVCVPADALYAHVLMCFYKC